MKITKLSPLSGFNTMDIDVDPQTYQNYIDGYDNRLIQDIFPDLTPDEREFIKTGYTKEDWDMMFPPEDDDIWESE